MPEPRKRVGRWGTTTHKIFNIDYTKTRENPDGFLECLCGWVGRAWDVTKSDPRFGDEKDWPLHKKTAPPITITMEDRYAGNYATTTLPLKTRRR